MKITKGIFKKRFPAYQFINYLFYFCVAIILVYIVGFFVKDIFLPTQIVNVISQDNYFSSSPAGLRIILEDESNKDKPIANASIKVEILEGSDNTIDTIYEGRGGENGIADLNLMLPELKPGKYKFKITVKSKKGKDIIEKEFNVQTKDKYLITTDRPLYKPGDTIKFRVLNVNKYDLKPVTGNEITLMIYDGAENKIYQNNYITNDYGIIDDQLPLASELNSGNFTIKVVHDKQEISKTVQVKPFVLPKFKVDLITDSDYFNLKDKITGKVDAKYFFGEAVENAKVKVWIEGMNTNTTAAIFTGVQKNLLGSNDYCQDTDGGANYGIRGTVTSNVDDTLEMTDRCIDEDTLLEFGCGNTQGVIISSDSIKCPGGCQAGKCLGGDTEENNDKNITKLPYYNEGFTDSNGIFKFEFDGFYSEKLGVNIVAEVIDQSNRMIKSSKTINISNQKFKMEVISENAKLKRGISNSIYVVTTTIDGYPISLDVKIQGDRMTELRTNQFGIGKFDYYVNNSQNNVDFTVIANDSNGNTLSKKVKLQTDNNKEFIDIQTDKNIYPNGDTMKLKINSNFSGNIFVDITKDNSLVKTITIEELNKEIEINLGQKLFGIVELKAYSLDETSSSVIKDNKIIFIDNQGDLFVDIIADKTKYKPGENAQLNFEVKNLSGSLEDSALGIKIVDKSLLSLADDEMGMERLYLIIDENIQNANINNINLIDNIAGIRDESRQILAGLILNSVGTLNQSSSILTKHHKNDKHNSDLKKGKALNILAFIFFIFAIISINRILYQSHDACIEARSGLYILKYMTLTIVSIILLFSALVYVISISNFNIELIFESWKFIYQWYVGTLDSYYFLVVLGLLIGLSIYLYIKATVDKSNKNIIVEILKLLAIMLFFALIKLFDSTLYHSYSGFFEWLGMIMFYFAPILLLFSMTMLRAGMKGEGEEMSLITYMLIFLTSLFFLLHPRLAIALIILVIIYNSIHFVKNYDFTDHDQWEEELTMLEERSGSIRSKLSKKDKKAKFKLALKKKSYIYRRRGVRNLKIGLILLGIAFAIWFVTRMFYFITSTALIDSLSTSTSSDRFYDRDPEYDINYYGGGGGGGGDSFAAHSGMGNIRSNIAVPGGSSNDIKQGVVSSPIDNTIGNVYKLSTDVPFLNEKDEKTMPMDEETIKERRITGDNPNPKQFKKAEKLRKFFPETMYWHPALIASDGTASINITVPDSITTWKISALANAKSGKIGSNSSELLVFQDFFIDFSLPKNLVIGDEVSIPLTIFNYDSGAQDIKIIVEEQDWFELKSDNNKVIKVKGNSQEFMYIKIKTLEFGNFNLKIEAQGTQNSDAVQKSIEVFPDGKKIEAVVASSSLGDQMTEQVIFPEDHIDGSAKVQLKIYPDYMSQVVEGLESMLRFPSGCFEQTSSSLYPNILVLKYLKASNQDNPEIEKKALDYIKAGVQKLLTYEDRNGGFTYWGNNRGYSAETILSAVGLMQFTDLKDIYQVDENLLQRTREYLFKNQNYDGSFKMTGSHRSVSGVGDQLSKNAYIIRALSNALPGDRRLEKSINYLKNKKNELSSSPYALALATNAILNYNQNDSTVSEFLSSLSKLIAEGENDTAYLTMKKTNHYGSYGNAGNIEVTALACMAFNKSSTYKAQARKTLNYIIQQKDSRGTWYSTQASVLALRALSEVGTTVEAADVKGSIKVSFNGQEQTINIDKNNSTVVQLLSFESDIQDTNEIKISKEGDISSTYQLTKAYYEPWPQRDIVIEDYHEEKDKFNNNDYISNNTGTINTGDSLINNELNNLVNELVEVYTGKVEKREYYRIPKHDENQEYSLLTSIGDSSQVGYCDNYQCDWEDLKLNNSYDYKIFVKNNSSSTKQNVMIIASIPAGFIVQEDKLEDLVNQKIIAKYEITWDKVNIYLNSLSSSKNISFEIIPTYPVITKVQPSIVYDYYNPMTIESSYPLRIITKK